jgi:serine phosphatase RsbU (regulator of sigma subunit)
MSTTFAYRLVFILLFTTAPVMVKAGISDVFSDQTNIYIICAFILLSLLNLLIFRYRTRALRRSNKILREKEVAARFVLRQKNVLSSRNKNIEDSLKYAERIQKAMFTRESDIAKMFPDSFIFQKPKDIVSGDFYWGKKIGDTIFLAAVDCTGHGVPGAFMSLIGLEMFRQIVCTKEIYTPGKILDEMNKSFDVVFDTTEEMSLRDGMDLTICSMNTKTNMLVFAGAFNPLYIIRNREIIEIKGDKTLVGPYMGFDRLPFTNHEFQLESQDRIYMFSDGYADQFGGPEGKKFKYRRFRHLLLSICDQPLSRQHDILENSMEDWKGDLEQVDDILVIGAMPVL